MLFRFRVPPDFNYIFQRVASCECRPSGPGLHRVNFKRPTRSLPKLVLFNRFTSLLTFDSNPFYLFPNRSFGSSRACWASLAPYCCLASFPFSLMASSPSSWKASSPYRLKASSPYRLKASSPYRLKASFPSSWKACAYCLAYFRHSCFFHCRHLFTAKYIFQPLC